MDCSPAHFVLRLVLSLALGSRVCKTLRCCDPLVPENCSAIYNRWWKTKTSSKLWAQKVSQTLGSVQHHQPFPEKQCFQNSFFPFEYGNRNDWGSICISSFPLTCITVQVHSLNCQDNSLSLFSTPSIQPASGLNCFVLSSEGQGCTL